MSNKCCYWNKELPLMRYAKEHGKKSIIGVRQSESNTRKCKYNTCLQKNGNFAPLYDFSDKLVDLIYEVYKIEIPKCYDYLTRTGCAGCPYGRNTENELGLVPDGQRKHIIEFFKDSYDVLGINYTDIQISLYRM